MSSTPTVKFENSPAESAMSLPMEAFSPLFASTSLPTPMNDEIDPMDSMSPESMTDERPPEDIVLAALAASLSAGEIATAVAASTTGTCDESGSEKRPVKKRKSWGQVLPEPKTNLPPRKRAKTADEKEQRRVERVLRNRRAAQSSRERKRLEVEALERRNKELETRITLVERANLILIDELNKQRQNGTSPSPVIEALSCSNAMTLSSDLFNGQESLEQLFPAAVSSNTISTTTIPNTTTSTTVDPASLSPPSIPADVVNPTEAVKQQKSEPMETIMAIPATADKSADLTQRPAEMLCDLQCQSAASSPSSMAPRPMPQLSLLIHLHSLLTASSALLSVCRRPLTQIAMSLKTGFPLPPTPSILTAIVWLVTRPSTRTSTTLTTSSSSTREVPSTRLLTVQASQRTRSSHSGFRTLRVKTLRKILTCSPSLARPLQDATMAVLRLVTKRGNDNQTLGTQSPSDVQREDLSNRLGSWANGTLLPSQEALLTLLWVLRLEEKRLQRAVTLNTSKAASSAESRREPLVSTNSTTTTTSML